MFISAATPSARVAMFAVPGTGPGCAKARTGSAPFPSPVGLTVWKFPNSSVKPSIMKKSCM